MSNDTPQIVYLVLLLVLVASALFSRRLPLGQTFKMAIAWICIFGIAFVLFAFRDDFSSIAKRLRAEATGEPVVAGETLRIPISEDGHYWVDGSINGKPVRFLVDSGASITTIPAEVATAAGLETGIRSDAVSTANGIVVMKKSSAERFRIGHIERSDFGVNINENDDTAVLGMNFLSSLSSWRVEGRYLVLAP